MSKKQLDPKIVEALKKHGFGPESAWDCHGTWVIYHRVLEQIAAKAGIKFEAPLVLEADGANKVAAICVTGRMGDASEWSIGEAAPGNNKNAYPFAMAEKRAKDRVVLKLIGIHGLAYSEDEADDFKAAAPVAPQMKDRATYVSVVKQIIASANDSANLGEWWNSEEEKSNRRKYGLDDSEILELKNLVIAKRDALTGKKAA